MNHKFEVRRTPFTHWKHVKNTYHSFMQHVVFPHYNFCLLMWSAFWDTIVISSPHNLHQMHPQKNRQEKKIYIVTVLRCRLWIGTEVCLPLMMLPRTQEQKCRQVQALPNSCDLQQGESCKNHKSQTECRPRSHKGSRSCHQQRSCNWALTR